MTVSPKDEVRRILDQAPDDVSFEDLQYLIYVRHKIARGQADVQAGRVLTSKQLRQRVGQWLGQ